MQTGGDFHSMNHAIERMRERHGIELSPTAYRRLCLRISGGNQYDYFPLSLRLDGREDRHLLAVFYQGQWFPAVWNPRTKRILTVLSKSYVRWWMAALQGEEKKRFLDLAAHHRKLWARRKSMGKVK